MPVLHRILIRSVGAKPVRGHPARRADWGVPPSGRILLVLAAAGLAALPGRAAVAYPADAVVDVTAAPYHADPTGVTDATAALQAAMDDHDGAITTRVILYFPDGIYRLTDRLRLDTHNGADGGSGRGIVFQGESREGVILRLDANAADFDDVANPKPVVDFNEANEVGGWQYVAFQTHLKDLTIEVGSGNPGAIGLDFCANNAGGLRNVAIRSLDPGGAGYAGLLLSGIPGPQLIKGLEVEGFEWGIRTEDDPHYTTTMEDVLLRDCRSGGLYNQRHSFAIHRLETAGLGGPALINVEADAFATLVGGHFRDGPADQAAIVNHGNFYGRQLLSTGYARILDDSVVGIVAGSNLSEWYDGIGENLFPSGPMVSLGLPIEDAGLEDRDPPAQWVSALSFGGNAAPDNFNDDSGAVQQAIDSMAPGGSNAGKRTLYLPPGLYLFDHTVVIPSYVERIVGCYARVKPRHDAISTAPVWRIAGGGGAPLVIEQLFGEPGGPLRATPFIRNDSDRDLVLRDLLVLAGQVYQNSGTGRLFLENVAGTSSRYWTQIPQPLPSAIPQFDFGGQDVWARQLNSEQKDLKVRNDGGDVWILGIKNEEDGTLIETRAGGRTELLGGTVMPLDVDDLVSPAFAIVDSAFSASVASHIGSARDYYAILVAETRGEETRTLASADATFERSYTNHVGTHPPVLPLFRASARSAAEHWRLHHFGTAANSGIAADDFDAEGDGLTNLEERAFRRNPLAAETEPLVTVSVITLEGVDYAALSWEQRRSGSGTVGIDYTAEGLTYVLEQAPDLPTAAPWSSPPLPPVLLAAPTDTGHGLEQVTTRSATPLEADGPPQFLRLRVETSP